LLNIKGKSAAAVVEFFWRGIILLTSCRPESGFNNFITIIFGWQQTVMFRAILALTAGAVALAASPPDAVKVFVKGEAGYYCHKIPYLYRTMNNVLIALAEGRGKDGRSSCDDFSVCEFMSRFYTEMFDCFHCFIFLSGN
jgi:hypothetical protein